MEIQRCIVIFTTALLNNQGADKSRYVLYPEKTSVLMQMHRNEWKKLTKIKKDGQRMALKNSMLW